MLAVGEAHAALLAHPSAAVREREPLTSHLAGHVQDQLGRRRLGKGRRRQQQLARQRLERDQLEVAHAVPRRDGPIGREQRLAQVVGALRDEELERRAAVGGVGLVQQRHALAPLEPVPYLMRSCGCMWCGLLGLYWGWVK